ncbi:hypothetical protein TNCV_3851371 [Trichonephila clavipes]|nr:hypothetical protein TNCV_3851371 [Trichonephila clavipes]
MEGLSIKLSIKKTKKRKRVRELRENPSWTKTGKVRTEGGGALEIMGGAQQFEVPRAPERLKTALWTKNHYIYFSKSRRVPQKTSRAERLMHVGSIEARSPRVVVVWELGKGCSSSVVFVTSPWFKTNRSTANSSHIALESHVNENQISLW